ncbi:MAG: thymidine phosphorylase [Ardenticatenales bacterium]|jgi:pyrimidine-nucleoside phosphorylase|nr:thymidine phosphorylase [Ardenticatenales bacterium]
MHSILPLIEAKRDGHALGAADITALIRAVVRGDVPDYQLAAWLMAVVLRGMDASETASLTDAMANSGVRLDLSRITRPIVDKHSTGGVGDKTTLVVAPLAAATGLVVAKMSGRGLGHTGGTLDKLESIPGLTVDLDTERFILQAQRIGLVIAGQSADLAPADRILYALRDVTGTVPSLPLIAASIMSKKLAAGARAIVLDVKVGKGAFMTDLDSARSLAGTMVALGRAADPPRRVAALISAMDEPLGFAIGNALEVREAVQTLRGAGPADLTALSLELAGLMHVAGGTYATVDDARPALLEAIRSGQALECFKRMVEAQGGDPRAIDDDVRLPRADVVHAVRSERAGILTTVDARALGDASVALGAGRCVKGEAIDPAVGIVLEAKAGATVSSGDTLAWVHARSETAAEAGAAAVRAAMRLDEADGSAAPRPLVLESILP